MQYFLKPSSNENDACKQKRATKASSNEKSAQAKMTVNFVIVFI